MDVNPIVLRGFLPLLVLLTVAAGSPGRTYGARAQGAQAQVDQAQVQTTLSPAAAQGLLDRALANELRAAQSPGRLERYRLRKSTPRLTTTKEIVETSNGDVALLLSVNGQPLSAVQKQQEQARLDDLLANPGRQRHRQQSEDADSARALKVLGALPNAFIYSYAGPAPSPLGTIEKFTFKPNPDFDPPDLETQILTAMTGQIWIDPAAERVTHIEGRLEHDIAVGWGILGRLNKGGWISIDQADVGEGRWRMVHLQMAMTARVLFRTRTFDAVEEEGRFEPVPAGMDYREAIEILRNGP
ncbi:MAG: hypothetical protein ACRD3N_12510 [Terracidiphilus sp.]